VRIWLPLLLVLKVTPNVVTLGRLAVAVAGAIAFADGRVFLGALAAALWYILDCIDGKLARLKQMTSAFGDWLVRFTDRLGIGAMMFAQSSWLIGRGQTAAGLVGIAFVLTWFLRCMNGDRLGWIRERWERSPRPGARDMSQGSSREPSLRTRLREFSARTRITLSVVHDVEWLAMSLIVAPLSGRYVACFLIAGFGIAIQMLLHILWFWSRRLKVPTQAAVPLAPVATA
jgi:hypothetical protein